MLKRMILYILVFTITFSFGAMSVAATEVDEAITDLSVCKGIDAEDPYWDDYNLIDNVQSAFLYELRSESLLYAYAPDTLQYPASLVKIMTALLVLEKCNLSDVVTVSQTAVNSISYQDISADLVAGERLTVEDLLYCMMVKSANDAAIVLAEHVAGSQGEFVKLMNEKAASLGCTKTFYVNASGLHDPEQVTTARDICKILRAALQNDDFRTLFCAVNYTVPVTNMNPEERHLSSGNYLINPDQQVVKYLDSRVKGGRTGVTAEGYRCVASLAQERNMEVVCIVMGCASTYAENGNTEVYGGYPETISLLNHAFEGNALKQIIYKNQNMKQLSVVNGDCDLFVSSVQDISAILPADYTLNDLIFSYSYIAEPLQAPIHKGQVIGSVRVMDGSVCVAQTDLYASNDVPVAFVKAGKYMEVKPKNYLWVIFLIVAILLAASVFMFYRIRNKRIKQPREPV